MSLYFSRNHYAYISYRQKSSEAKFLLFIHLLLRYETIVYHQFTICKYAKHLTKLNKRNILQLFTKYVKKEGCCGKSTPLRHVTTQICSAY